MFSLHVIQADCGDCLLLQYGTPGSPRFILIDGGPPTVFSNHMKSVLEETVAPWGRRLDRVILSHIDGDHITGILDLLADLRAQRENGATELVSVDGLWFNSFASTVDPNNHLAPKLKALLATAGVASAMSRTAASVMTIEDGDALRRFATILGIPLNPNAADPIAVDAAAGPVPFGNLSLDVVGPTQANLDALRQEWGAWLAKHENGIAAGNAKVMANADTTVANLSSICLLARADGKSVLLTGDARSDHILDGLATRKLLNASGRAHFSVLKLPHHGSDRNITKTFFLKVTADTYVISANGDNGNPDLATLTWLVEAARKQKRRPEIVVTNETESTARIVQECPPGEYGYRLRFLPASGHAVEIPLA